MEFIKKYKYSLIVILLLIVFGRFFFNKSMPIDNLVNSVESNSVILKYDKHDSSKIMTIDNEEDMNKLREILYGTKIKKIGRKSYVQDRDNKAFTLDFEDDLVLAFRDGKNVDITTKENGEIFTRSYRVLSGLKKDEIFKLFEESTSK